MKNLGFVTWVSMIYILKDALAPFMEDSETFYSGSTRDFFAENGVEMTPDEFNEYLDVVKGVIKAAEWYECRIQQ